MTQGLNRRMRQAKRVHHADETKPYAAVSGYVHSATVNCPACEGSGWMRFRNQPGKIVCVACNGAKRVVKGCGGSAEIEPNYRTAYCFQCGGFVSRNEVTKP